MNKYDISFLFVTMNRPQAARRLIDSVRHMYPNMPIHVGDQSEPNAAMRTFYEDRKVHAKFLPFDSGVSYGRAELIKDIATDYVLFGDDDFIFTEKTCFDVPRQILERNTHIGLVGGSIIDVYKTTTGEEHRGFRRFEKKLYFDEDSHLMISVPIDHLPPEIGCLGNQQFYFCDMTLNWALCRRDLFADRRVLWDPRFKSNGEHENFFLQLKKYSPYRVVYYPGMQCDHHHIGDANYEKLRERQTGWLEFGRKWNVVAHLELGVGLRYYADYERPVRYDASCSQSGDPQMPPLAQACIRVWPEGYVQAVEPKRDDTINEFKKELELVQGSRAYRMATLMRRVAIRLRKVPAAKFIGRQTLAFARRLPGPLKRVVAAL